MLGESKLKVFTDLINSSGKDELLWMNGYLNGVVANFATASNAAPTDGAD